MSKYKVTHLRDYDVCATMRTNLIDGTCRLTISLYGEKLHDRVHKNERAAKAAWYRWTA